MAIRRGVPNLMTRNHRALRPEQTFSQVVAEVVSQVETRRRAQASDSHFPRDQRGGTAVNQHKRIVDKTDLPRRFQ